MNRDSKSPWFHALPNQLTMFRVASVPLFLAISAFEDRSFRIIGAFLFLLSALSDWLDGYFARLWKVESKFGAILDPLADKIAVAAALIIVASRYPSYAPLFAVLLARDVGVTGMRLIALEKGIHVAVNSFGKIKTILLDTCLVCLLMGENLWGWPWMEVGKITLVLSLFVSLYSAWIYWRVFSEHADF